MDGYLLMLLFLIAVGWLAAGVILGFEYAKQKNRR